MILVLSRNEQDRRTQPAHGTASDGFRHRLIIADDDPHIRREIVHLLGTDYELVAIVMDGLHLCADACMLKPHLIIADIGLPRMSGLEAVRLMRLQGVESKIIFFTTNGNPLYVRKAFSLGASGYVLKALGIEELPAAIRIVLRGGSYVSPSIAFVA